MSWLVKAGPSFWATLQPLRSTYSHEQVVEIILIVKDCIRELEEKGHVDVSGWHDHRLVRSPFADGCHFEFHIYYDDVLVLYFKLERKRAIRMVGIYPHQSIPDN